jgi:hypothetical protein
MRECDTEEPICAIEDLFRVDSDNFKRNLKRDSLKRVDFSSHSGTDVP